MCVCLVAQDCTEDTLSVGRSGPRDGAAVSGAGWLPPTAHQPNPRVCEICLQGMRRMVIYALTSVKFPVHYTTRLHYMYPVYYCCVLLVCTIGVYYWCVLLLCTTSVYYRCVLLVCTIGVYYWCVLLLCTVGVYCWCALLVCDTCKVCTMSLFYVNVSAQWLP